MNTKYYLLRYRKYKEKAERYRERIAQLENTLKGVNLDGMPHGTNLSDPTKTAALNLTLLKEQLKYAVIEAEAVCQEIAAQIEKVNNPQFNELLYCRYILLLSWNDTAERLREHRKGADYDIKYVCGDMHRRALIAFNEVLKHDLYNNTMGRTDSDI